jgi:hypothetical protein
MSKAKEIYAKVRETYPKADAVYEDAIIALVGLEGLIALREMHLIETCAVFERGKLYAL